MKLRHSKIEVSREAVVAAMRDLFDVEPSGGQSDRETHARRLAANVLRHAGATWAEITALLGGDCRYLVRSEPPTGAPLWACWSDGLPDDGEAEAAGEKFLAHLRGSAGVVAVDLRKLDRRLADLIDQAKNLRRELRGLTLPPAPPPAARPGRASP